LRDRFAEIGRDVPAPAKKPDPRKWSDQELTVAWLGHATVLVNFYGFTILTDPAFFPRVGPDWQIGQIGPKRLVACALRPDELPAIDLVLISHAHFDHLDTPSLRSIPGKPELITAKATADLIPSRRFKQIRELKWGEAASVSTKDEGTRVRAFEVRHWGARWRNDQHRGYNGYVIERGGRSIVFGGDTADSSTFGALRQAKRRAIAVMPIGAYEPWIRSHCTPEQALAMANAAGADYFVPIHHQSFRLSREPILEPVERITIALAAEPQRLALSEVGATFRLKS
jgi:L-ascorbate metabolism protein UlaG (beta-lactamase superfamily)